MAEVGIFGAFFFASFGFAELTNVFVFTSDPNLVHLLGSFGQAKEP